MLSSRLFWLEIFRAFLSIGKAEWRFYENNQR